MDRETLVRFQESFIRLREAVEDTRWPATQDSNGDTINNEDRSHSFGKVIAKGRARVFQGNLCGGWIGHYGDVHNPTMVSSDRLMRVLNQCRPKIAAALSRAPSHQPTILGDRSDDLGVDFVPRILNYPQPSFAKPECNTSSNILILAAAGPASTYVIQAILAAKLTDGFGHISIYVSKKTILYMTSDTRGPKWWDVGVHVGDADEEAKFKNACQDVDTIVSCLEGNCNVPLEAWAEQLEVRRFLRIKYSADIQDKTVAVIGGKIFKRQLSRRTESMTVRYLPDSPDVNLLTEIALVRHHSQYCFHDSEHASSTSVTRILPKRLDALIYNRLPSYSVREKTLLQTSLLYQQKTTISLLRAAGSSGPASIEAYSTLLCIAVLVGRTNAVPYLARAGADLNRKNHGTGLTPLHHAVIAGSPAMVRTLLTYGAIASVENDTAFKYPQFRWVDRIIAYIAFSTKTGEIPVVSRPVDGAGTSNTISGRKRKYMSGNYAGVAPVSKKPASISQSSSDDRADQSDEDDEPKKRKRGQANRDLGESYEERFKFACPYAKYDPSRFGDIKCCGLTGYDDIPRLKDHLNRKHRLYSCERCGLASFRNKDEVNDHIAADDCVKSAQPQRAYSDGYSTRQADKIEGRWRGQDAGKKWEKIYRILFGLDDSHTVPFPYFETRAQLQYENQRLQEALREALGSRYSAEQLPRQIDAIMLGIRRDFREDRYRIQDVSDQISIDDDETAPAVVEAMHEIPVMTSCIRGDRINGSQPYQEFRTQPDLSGRYPEPDVLEAIDLGHESSSWPPDEFGNIFDILNDDTLARESSVSSIDRIWSNDSMTSTDPDTSVEDTIYDVATQKADPEDKIQRPTGGILPFDALDEFAGEQIYNKR